MKARYSCIIITVASFTACLLYSPDAQPSTPLHDCYELTKVLSIQPNICSGSIPYSYIKSLKTLKSQNVVALNQLGIVLRKLGFLEEAKATINRGLELSPDNSDLKLSLANVEKQIFKRSLSNYVGTTSRRDQLKNDEKISAQANLVLSQYENIFGTLESPLQIKAAINWLEGWSELDNQLPELANIQNSKLKTASNLITKVNSRILTLEDSEALLEKLYFSEYVWKCRNLLPEAREIARQNIFSAINVSKSTHDLVTFSKAKGIYSEILYEQGNIREAFSALESAISSAKSMGAIDIAQKQEARIANLYEKTGDPTKATTYYETAISDIESIQPNILSLKNELQFTFRDQIEPTYRQYLELLFKEKQPNLEKILQVYERLQVGEIENYLQCSDLGLTSRILDLPPDKSPDLAIYLIQMPHQYAVVLRDKNRKLSYRLLNYNEVNEGILTVRQALEGHDFKLINNREMKNISHDLYNAVISPVANLLPQSGNLVWIVDPKLQNIPWGLLSDGSQYLLEKYSISYSLGVELEPPQPINHKNLTALIAGSSTFPGEPSYTNLPSVHQEIEAVQQTISGIGLIDKDFTYNHLLQHTGYPIIHIASHAQYSSNPDESFILSWKNRIKMQDLQQLVESNKTPLELLVISACESAEGDSKATLGIAGTAVKSGARSTAASLWLVSDASQVELMRQFYRGLKQGMSRSQALQQAQLLFLDNKDWGNPYYWANMMLLGSFK